MFMNFKCKFYNKSLKYKSELLTKYLNANIKNSKDFDDVNFFKSCEEIIEAHLNEYYKEE